MKSIKELRHQLNTPEAIQAFLFGGKAFVTLLNTEKNTRLTFKVNQPKKLKGSNMHFVSVMKGADNEQSYTFVGTIFDEKSFKHSRKSMESQDGVASKTINAFMNMLNTKQIHSKLEVWHEGRCGCCGRKLTVPESIVTGLGPLCAARKAKATDSKPAKQGIVAKKELNNNTQ